MPSADRNERDTIRRYVESQANERVVHIEKAASELVGPVRHEIWDVHCSSTRWWVVTNPINLYSQADFKSRDGLGTRPAGAASDRARPGLSRRAGHLRLRPAALPKLRPQAGETYRTYRICKDRPAGGTGTRVVSTTRAPQDRRARPRRRAGQAGTKHLVSRRPPRVLAGRARPDHGAPPRTAAPVRRCRCRLCVALANAIESAVSSRRLPTR